MTTKGLLIGAVLGLTTLSGCQSWIPEAGITAPSPHYLKHSPQYFPPSEPYPLPKELRSSEEAAKALLNNQRQ